MNPSELRLEAHGPPAGPTLLYLPGVHGDNTLFGSFRARLGDDVRLLEVIYPAAASGTLNDLAASVWQAAARVTHGPIWLLAESFGSQVAWAMLSQTPPREVRGVILAGGFVRHPWPWAVRLTRFALGQMAPGAVRTFFRIYPLWARLAYRNAPEVAAAIPEFVARRRQPADHRALVHRLRLIELADFRETVRELRVPVWQLTGRWDPIVPWWSVRRWLRGNSPGYQGTAARPGADHVVLATDAVGSVAAVRRWMELSR
jgi:pimeloyl-ACP methyl ester carboxylesterase